ncbi:MarR family winged helix-turn-helix transcriptional regulator [Fusibacter ferrireducens]|uniref:MarR family transcriptional regulator n=1 Tax=Fusibacter ferrireducens TaxID=2785058 RepID=A0ABR9ZR07_9FIRM|nr:MarR family transcriptional regulator [Fusibacter ferrireducens]MBF4692876.1 MarR family transcriptional regulator [Fusibacter ferrireducens]
MHQDNGYLKLETLLEALAELKGQCTFQLIDELDADQLTVKQIEYLKLIDEFEATTISNLAEILDLKKPTVTETVHKLQNLDCVMKHQCSLDGRIYYITLTDKGEKLARLDQMSYRYLVEKIVQRLETNEIEILTSLLEKLMI